MRKTEEMPCGFDVKKCYLCDAEKVILKPYQKMEKKKKKKKIKQKKKNSIEDFIIFFFFFFFFLVK